MRKCAKILSIVPVLALSALILSGCTGDGAGQPASGGTLNYFLGEPVAIDPLNISETEGQQVAKQLFDGLVDYDPNTMKVTPAVAASWHSNPGATVFTFKLRPGVRFHNGRGVTAGDFKYAWERVAAKKSASEAAYHLAPIKGFGQMQSGKAKHLAGVRARDKRTLEVTLDYPFAEFPVVLGHPVFSPVPREAVEKNPKRFADQPVGNGPFAMDGRWQHDKSIALKRFDRYYGRRPHISGVNFRIIKDQDTAFLEFRGGTLDYTPIPAGQVKAVANEFGDEAVIGKPQLGVSFYGFNLSRKPFKGNKHLRQAINYAINRRAIVDTLYEGAHVPAGALLPPAVSGGRRAGYDYDAKKAARLLAKAGYRGGKGLPAITITYAAGRGHDGPATIVQANLAKLGVKVKLEALERGAFIEAMGRGKVTMFAAGWQADYPTADAFLYPLFHSANIGADNVFNFKRPEVDRLLDKARRTLADDRRQALYDEAERRVLEEAPVVPLYVFGSSAVRGPDVRGFIRTAFDDTPLDRVWLEK